MRVARFRGAMSLVFAIAAVLSSVVDKAGCQGPEQGRTAPYISFEGVPLLNNSRVQLSQVGTNSTGFLRCHTDLTDTCCNNGSHSGRWVAVDRSGDFYQQRLVQGGVDLHSVDAFSDGNFRCEIDTAVSIARGGPRDIVYVSVIQGAEISVSLRLRVLPTRPPLYTLICRTASSPATTVTWRRDSEVIEGGTTVSVTRLNYFNELNVTEEGVYSCEVFTRSTFRDTNEIRTLNVTRPLPPANLTVTQTGPSTAVVSWIPTGRPSQYTIYYEELGLSPSRVGAGPNDTSVSLPISSNFGQTYLVSIIAETALVGDKVGPVRFTLGNLLVNVRGSVPRPGPYLGQLVRVSCQVILTGSATGTPTITWHTPLPTPTPSLSSQGEGIFVSEFVIESFTPSHEGNYTCEASVDNLPFSVENSAIININQNSRLSVQSSITIQSMQPLQFTLICKSFGGFPANVTWTRDSTVIGSGVTMLDDDFRRYVHSLNATEEGLYTCTISNSSPDNATASINAIIPDPPSNLTVTQNGVDSVLVSWTPSVGAEFYTIFYMQNNQMAEMVMVLDGNADSTTIGISPTFSVLGAPFSFILVAHTDLPSAQVGPVHFTLGVLEVRVHSPFDNSAIVGRNFTLVCDVEVFGNLSGTPGFTWTGPGGALPVPVRTSNTRSELHFDILRLSQSGEYGCTVELPGFPYTSRSVYSLNPNYLVNRPRVSVRASRGGPYYAGTTLNLTCDIELDPAVDVPVVESVQWVIGGMVFNPPVTLDRVTITETAIDFFPVDVVDSTTFRCDVLFSTESDHQEGEEFQLTVEALPPLVVEIVAPASAIAGGSLTVECSVTAVPHLITPPQVRLFGPDGRLLVGETGYSVSETLNPVMTLQAGQQYFCEAELMIEAMNLSLSHSDTYTVTVEVPRPNVTVTAEPAEDSLMAGSTVTLTCQTALDPHVNTDIHFGSMEMVQITWEGPTGMAIEQNRTARDGLVHYSNITISDFQTKDEGLYLCTVRVLGGENIVGVTATGDISISIFTPPSPLIEITGPTRADGGSSVTLNCTVTPSPGVQPQPELSSVQLYREGGQEPVATSSGLSVSYTIDRLLASQAGLYYCSSMLKVEGLDMPLVTENLSHTLTVSIPSPTFALSSRPPENRNITLGSTVSLVCEVTIDSSYDVVESANVDWVGPRLSSGREGYTTTQSTNGVVFTGVLTISEVVKEDEGDYGCGLFTISGNSHVVTDSTTSFISLVVFVPLPTLVVTSSPPEEVETGSSLTLTCNATLHSQLNSVQLTWGGPQMINTNDESKHRIVQTSSGMQHLSNLTVSDVRKEDGGQYVCTLTGLGSNGQQIRTSNSITVGVTEPSSSAAGMHWSGLSVVFMGILALLSHYIFSA